MPSPHIISLVPFEASAAAQHFSCSTRIRLQGRLLVLDYTIAGPLPELSIPKKTSAAGFMPGLWQHTCCECFLRQGNKTSYIEWNFSPDCSWWNCRFDDYRKPAPVQPAGIQPQDFQFILRENMVTLTAAIECPPARGLRIGPALILEHADGMRSHWAMEHPGGTPDFHHAETCACIL